MEQRGQVVWIQLDASSVRVDGLFGLIWGLLEELSKVEVRFLLELFILATI